MFFPPRVPPLIPPQRSEGLQKGGNVRGSYGWGAPAPPLNTTCGQVTLPRLQQCEKAKAQGRKALCNMLARMPCKLGREWKSEFLPV